MFGAYYFGEIYFGEVLGVATPAPTSVTQGLRPSKIQRILRRGEQREELIDDFEQQVITDLQAITAFISLLL